MVSLLISKGADIEAKTRDGLTPLHCAARSGHDQVVDLLLESKAPMRSKTKVHDGWRMGRKLLHALCRKE